MTTSSRLGEFPIAFFSIVMGLTGMTIAVAASERVLGLAPFVSTGLLISSALIFLMLLLVYTVKMALHRPAVAAEWANPVKLSFFPTISISMILLSIASYRSVPWMSEYLLIVGASLQLIFTLTILSTWLYHTKFEIHHSNPAWFIPVVGNILVPIAGVHHFSPEISWFFFSIGILFWIVLFTIIVNRLIFHAPLPGKLMPTFFILIAPPAVGFLAYLALNGAVDGFARILYYSALFLSLLLLLEVPRFTKLQFTLSWWAYSFPMAAVTVATLVMFEHTGLVFFQILGMVFLVVLSLLILALVVKTLGAIRRKGICLPE